MNTETTRNAYRALMTACKPVSAADFNRRVASLMDENADGEPVSRTPAAYLDAAREVAYYVYGVNFRSL